MEYPLPSTQCIVLSQEGWVWAGWQHGGGDGGGGGVWTWTWTWIWIWIWTSSDAVEGWSGVEMM